MIITISKGQQITIPAIIRKELGIQRGTRVEIKRVGRRMFIEPLGEDLEFMFKKAKNVKPKHNLTAEEMDELNEKMMS